MIRRFKEIKNQENDIPVTCEFPLQFQNYRPLQQFFLQQF